MGDSLAPTHRIDGGAIAACVPELTASAGSGPGSGAVKSPLRTRPPDMARDVSAPLWETGHFALRPHLAGDALSGIAHGIRTLTRHGHRPVSIFLFDETWDLVRAVAPIAQYLLGDDAKLLPHLWAWHVGSGGTRSGWPPHRDTSGETVIHAGGMDMLMSLSLWIPLTDATPENGCMTVLRAGADPDDRQSLPICLPAPAGSVLGWRQDVWHWGGTARDSARTPRISLALEFQAGFVDPPLASPLIDPRTAPGLDQRCALIDAQIGKYSHMESG